LTEEELVERWALAPDELPVITRKSGTTRLGFAVLLRFFAGEGRFPRSKGEVPGQVVAYLGQQVGVPAEAYLRYDWRGRAIKYHRAQVRAHFGFKEASAEDGERIASCLTEEVLPREQDPDALRETLHGRCRTLKLKPPSEGPVERLLASARSRFEKGFCASLFAALPAETVLWMDALLASGADEEGPYGEGLPTWWDRKRSVLGWLRADPSGVRPQSVLEEVAKLRRVREVGIPEVLFD
jgi:hypothetical protein